MISITITSDHLTVDVATVPEVATDIFTELLDNDKLRTNTFMTSEGKPQLQIYASDSFKTGKYLYQFLFDLTNHFDVELT